MGTPAQIGAGQNHFRRRILIDLDGDCRMLQEHRHGATGMVHDGDADTASLHAGLVGILGPFFLPADRLGALLQTRIESAGRIFEAQTPAVVADALVPFHTPLDRIDTQLRAHLVDHLLHGEVRLGVAVTTESAAGSLYS